MCIRDSVFITLKIDNRYSVLSCEGRKERLTVLCSEDCNGDAFIDRQVEHFCRAVEFIAGLTIPRSDHHYLLKCVGKIINRFWVGRWRICCLGRRDKNCQNY